MSESKTFLATFLGDGTGARRREWDALSDNERRAREAQGMAAWKGWAERNQDAIVELGGPLGKTKRVSGGGIEDVSNALAAFTVVRADSQEAAARLFEGHPHFTIFPGEAVEIMPILPVSGA
ncbi:MAG TPA: hypothetical protein VLK25_09165 [Allosphingosinicella sp.]|nr:hypothetical protein [Allosphingosinicella sp.]